MLHEEKLDIMFDEVMVMAMCPVRFVYKSIVNSLMLYVFCLREMAAQ